jgi:DNA processing protein
MPAPTPPPAPDPELEDHRTPAGLLALLSLPGVGARTALRLAQGTAPPALAHKHLDGAALTAARAQAADRLAAHAAGGVAVLGFFDRRYPPRLRAIPDPPPLLFLRGEPKLLTTPRLAAVVGSREPSGAGVAATTELTAALAAAGWSILSGLAEGIDAAAHRAALAAGATNLALLAGGLDRISPRANLPLVEEILATGGALLGEHPLGTATLPAHLITRNRLQSGLASFVLITDCAARSGTMHTARYAAAQGRPVFVAPPRPAESEGTRLLRETPARELPDRAPAFARERALCERLGSAPLARPLELAALDAALALAEADARPDAAQSQLSFD